MAVTDEARAGRHRRDSAAGCKVPEGVIASSRHAAHPTGAWSPPTPATVAAASRKPAVWRHGDRPAPASDGRVLDRPGTVLQRPWQERGRLSSAGAHTAVHGAVGAPSESGRVWRPAPQRHSPGSSHARPGASNIQTATAHHQKCAKDRSANVRRG